MEIQGPLRFNLVYDVWEGLNPKSNGSDLFPNRNFDGDYYFLKNSGYDVTINKISDVYQNRHMRYFYFINHINGHIFEFFGEKNILSPEVVECLRQCNNFKVIFMTAQESDNKRSLETLMKFCKENSIKQESIYVINNNSKIYELKKLLKSKINVYNLNLLPFITKCAFSEYGGCNFYGEKKGKFFMSFTRNPKLHRLALLCFLKKNKILEKTNWSFIGESKRNFHINDFNLLFDDSTIYKDEIEYFDNIKVKRSDYESKLNFLDENNYIQRNENYNFLGHGIPELSKNYKNSYVNITTESTFIDDDDMVHISEKSLKPFFYYQIPLIVASSDHMKCMKEKYNLDFFEDLIDYSFDSENNHKKRFQMILKQIELLNKSQKKVKKFYKENKERFLENRSKILTNINIFDDRDYFNNLSING